MLKKYTNKINKKKLEKYIDIDFSTLLNEDLTILNIDKELFTKNKNILFLFELSYSFYFRYKMFYKDNNKYNINLLIEKFNNSLINNLENKFSGIKMKNNYIFFNKQLSNEDLEILKKELSYIFLEYFLTPVLSGKSIFKQEYNISKKQNITILFNIYDGFKIISTNIPKNIINNYYILIKEINKEKQKNYLKEKDFHSIFSFKRRNIFLLINNLIEKINKRTVILST